MKTTFKLLPKIIPKIGYPGLAFLGEPVLPNLDELVGEYIGTTSADGTELLAKSGDVDAKLTSHDRPCIAGNGADYITLDGDVTLVGGFTIRFVVGPTSTRSRILIGSTAASFVDCDGALSRFRGSIASTAFSFSGIDFANNSGTVTFTRNGSVGTVTTSWGENGSTTVSTGDMVFSFIGDGVAAAHLDTELGCLYGEDSTGPQFLYPLEAGEGLVAEDVIKGNDGTLTGAMWGTRDYGDLLMLAYGFSVDRVGYPGFSVVNPLTGLHQDGSSPTYPAGSWAGVLNAVGILWSGDSTTFADVPTFAADAQVDITGLPFNSNNQTFMCDIKGAIYGVAQDAASITEIGNIICLAYTPQEVTFDGDDVTFDGDDVTFGG